MRSAIRMKPVRVQFALMSLITIREPLTRIAAAMWKAAEDGSPGTWMSPSSSSSCWVSTIRSPSRVICGAGAGEQPLGVVAARLGLDHRRRPRGQQPGHQHARLDLRARHRQRVLDPAQRHPVHGERREAMLVRVDPRAHLAQRDRDAIDGAAADRLVTVEGPLAPGLTREPAGSEPHQRARVADVDVRLRGRAQPGSADRQRAGVGALLDERAERADGVERRVRVGRLEVARDLHGLVAHRAEERRTVRHRLVAGRAQRAS